MLSIKRAKTMNQREEDQNRDKNLRERDQENFDKWVAAWDKASEEWAKESSNAVAKAEPTAMSWLTGTPMDRDYNQDNETEVDPDWHTIYYRAQNLHSPTDDAGNDLITDGVQFDKGVEKAKANFGAFTPTKMNPTRQSTTGADQGDGNGVRVTDNWSDGEGLRELDDIKRRLEQMERKHHEEEVNKGSSSLKKELESLRGRIAKLSEKINSEPEVDVT
jgi:hypothetical protein